MDMGDLYINVKDKDYSTDSRVEDKVSDCENLPQSSLLIPTAKRVRFSRTQVYYFNRQQGYSSVPQRGGCSLGMALEHFHSEVHKESSFRKIRQSEKRLNPVNNFTAPSQLNCRGRRRKRKQPRATTIYSDKDSETNVNKNNVRLISPYFSPPKLSPQRLDSTDCKITQTANIRTPSPPCLSPQEGVSNIDISIDIPETDSENSMESFAVPRTTTKKLLPLPPVVRTRLLKQAGVINIDDSERLNCAVLRNSRTTVGCGCISSFCNPETCSCALDGIPCQVDRPGFPCSCSEQCKNPCGRIEFSTTRVRSHALHVFQRQLENDGDRLQPVSSEHGECLQCLQERLSQLESSPTSLPPSPIAKKFPSLTLSPPLHSPGFNNSIYDLPSPPLASSPPIFPGGADHSIFRLPLMTPIIVNSSFLASSSSSSTSKAIVVYKPPSSILRECFGKDLDTGVLQQIPKPITEDTATENVNPLNGVPVADGVDNIKLEPGLEVAKDTVLEPADYDACLQGKAIFTANSSILRMPSPLPPKIPSRRSVKFIQTLASGPNPECIPNLNRLGPCKRSIIMCDANNPLAPIWPPPKGGVNIDEIWDDGPLLQNYKSMEEHVKKQVERFKNSVRPPPPPSVPAKSTHPTPPVPQSLPTQSSATTPGRKKRRNNKHKRGGGAAPAAAASQQQQQTPVTPVLPSAIVTPDPAPAPISNPAPPSSPSPPSNGVEQHLSPQHPTSPHPPCSSSTRGPEGLHASLSDNKAMSNPETVSANTPSAASPTAYATAPSSPARVVSNPSPISVGPSVGSAIPDAALAPAPVVPAPAPAAIPAPMYPLISHLPVDLMPPPHPPALCSSPSGNSSARFGGPQQSSCLLPTPVEAQTTSSLTASLTTPNGEFNMSLLLRAWYEAGYAMGQAHADQILGLRSGPCGSGDGSDEDEDDDDGEEVEQQVVQQKKGKPRKSKKALTTSNLCSDSSGVSSFRSSELPTMIQDPNILSFYPKLSNTEIRRTFQLFSRVVESRVRLSWIPQVFSRIPCAQSKSEEVEVLQSGTAKDRSFGAPAVVCFLLQISSVSPRYSLSSSQPPHPNLPSVISSKTADVVIDLVNTFESRYADDYESLIGDALLIHNSVSATDSSASEVELDVKLLSGPYPTDYSSLRLRYFKILEGLFVSQINWGRIVAMISFLRALCVVLDTTPGSQSSLSSVDDSISMSPKVANLQLAILHYLIWTTEFIHKQPKLWDWIKDHGGWEGLEKFYYGEKSTLHSQLLLGLALILAPVGFVSAIRFVFRQLWPRTFE
ncbi:unnamed protein product [Rodentolepis nana]|uniref:CSRNP_N domain-containing protein n=1 Tax=Rodentolepis nana TaxID=102285 RepID=A0A158QHI3_RODNA|nr:unnamed protein product [Rodentolepis nana]